MIGRERERIGLRGVPDVIISLTKKKRKFDYIYSSGWMKRKKKKRGGRRWEERGGGGETRVSFLAFHSYEEAARGKEKRRRKDSSLGRPSVNELLS